MENKSRDFLTEHEKKAFASTLNTDFLEANKRARINIICSVPAVLVLSPNDTLVLQQRDKSGNLWSTVTKRMKLADYHIIKSLCHFISSVWLNLISNNDEDIDLNKHKEQTQKFIQQNAEMFQFEGVSYVRRLMLMLEPGKKVILHQQTIAIAMKQCATLYQNELHRCVQKLRSLVSESNWSRLLVIVTGAPSPRSGHSAMQYFSRLTGQVTPETCPFQEKVDPTITAAAVVDEQKHERQLFYVENVYPALGSADSFDQVLDIVAQEILERRLFDKVVDMKTDVLAFDTQAYLSKVCKK